MYYYFYMMLYYLGELAQVATLQKLECMIFQPSRERVVAVCDILDNLCLSDCKFYYIAG